MPWVLRRTPGLGHPAVVLVSRQCFQLLCYALATPANLKPSVPPNERVKDLGQIYSSQRVGFVILYWTTRTP